MAMTTNTDLVIYNDLAQTSFLERRQDNLEIFNTASNGAIILDNELIEGISVSVRSTKSAATSKTVTLILTARLKVKNRCG